MLVLGATGDRLLLVEQLLELGIGFLEQRLGLRLGLLLAIPKGGSWVDIVLITLKTAAGLTALAAAAQGWALRRTTTVDRALLTLAGLLLVFPSLIEAAGELITGRDLDYTEFLGLAIGAGVLGWQASRPQATAPAT